LIDTMSDVALTEKPRVLAAHDDVGTLRLIREALGSFAVCDVDTSPTAEYAFELGLQRDYKLFLFGLHLPVINGELLYDLLSKAYPYCHEGKKIAPAVIFIGDESTVPRLHEFKRDARVKDVVLKPLGIARLLQAVGGLIEMREDVL
jgi:CheY-like chemotaxis protein